MYQVFISYPRDGAAGQTLARELATRLKREQIRTFFDSDAIQPGDRWLNKLKQIADSQIVLSVIAPSSHDRQWFEREFLEAEANNITVIPVLAGATSLPMQFKDLQAVSLFGNDKADALDQLIQTLNQKLGIDQTRPLLKNALKAKRNHAYAEAQRYCEQVLALDEHHIRARQELETLQALTRQQEDSSELLTALIPHRAAIQPVFAAVINALSTPDAAQNHAGLLSQTRRFLQTQLTAEQYIALAESLLQTPEAATSTETSTTNHAEHECQKLAQRIIRGEVVLFLGADLQSGAGNIADEHTLAQQLAQQAGYPDFRDGLSAIAEYYRIDINQSENELLEQLRIALSQNSDEQQPLFTLLAQSDAPLVLISSAYDDALERSFDAAGKPYVVLSSIVERHAPHYDIGHLVVRYSDRADGDEKPYLEEDLSSFRPLDEGYSLIYKIRGTCPDPQQRSSLQRDTLTLAEKQYFTFARYADKIIPAHLSNEFRKSGFLFLGFSPTSWEDRLLANAILDKREHAREPCRVIGAQDDPLARAYWADKNVQPYALDLKTLDAHLEEALL